MAVRRAPNPPGSVACPVQAGVLRAGRLRDELPHLALVFLTLDVVEVDDVRRPLRRLRERQRLGLRLHLPRIVGPARDPWPAEPDGARPRQPPELGGMSRAVDEVLEPVA